MHLRRLAHCTKRAGFSYICLCVKLMLVLACLWKPGKAHCYDVLQETELAEMLEARVNSGKSASTSAPVTDGKLGIDNDAIFADLDTDGMSKTWQSHRNSLQHDQKCSKSAAFSAACHCAVWRCLDFTDCFAHLHPFVSANAC